MTGAEQMIEQLVMWRRKKFCLFPEDVINMMIDHGLCTEHQANEIIESTYQRGRKDQVHLSKGAKYD